MALYIKGIGNISPSLNGKGDTINSTDGDKFSAVEPEYADWIDTKYLRRMSRIIRMGVASSSMALREAKINVPDAIVTATGYGCLDDTGIFLARMVENKEVALNPTPFIQSTHNTIGSQIALLLQCQGYNQTYAHGALSFESALIDAMLHVGDYPHQHVLLGGIDEITDYSHAILKRFGLFRDVNDPNAVVNGEGAAFFVVTGTKDDDCFASIDSARTFYRPDFETLKINLQDICSSLYEPVDLFLLGKSGHQGGDETLQALVDTVNHTTIGSFKYWCGEYPSSSAFATWVATKALTGSDIVKEIIEKKLDTTPRNILIINHYFGIHYSMILMRAC